jgi:hypothetical protein
MVADGPVLGNPFAMGDDPMEVEKVREKVRFARAAYEEVRHAQTDPAQTKRLKAELYDAEAELVRAKRAQESAPPGHLL